MLFSEPCQISRIHTQLSLRKEYIITQTCLNLINKVSYEHPSVWYQMPKFWIINKVSQLFLSGMWRLSRLRGNAPVAKPEDLPPAHRLHTETFFLDSRRYEEIGIELKFLFATLQPESDWEGSKNPRHPVPQVLDSPVQSPFKPDLVFAFSGSDLRR